MGIHSDIFQVRDLESFSGQHLVFHWLRDDDLPDPRATPALLLCPPLAPVQVINIDGRTQWDGDRITAISEPVPWAWTTGQIQFVVATRGPVTWRKALTLYSAFDTHLSSVDVEGENSGSRPIIANFDKVWGGRLVFTKAKIFGVPANVYEYRLDGSNLDKIGARPGEKVTFEWQADNLPGPGCS